MKVGCVIGRIMCGIVNNRVVMISSIINVVSEGLECFKMWMDDWGKVVFVLEVLGS